MVVILDYGMGNSGSILNMIRKSGGNAKISVDPDDIKTATGFVLPGVGAFDNGMNKINSLEITALLEQRVFEEKIPFLGVCLGMQLLLNKSEEGLVKGLGWIDGEVKKFDFSDVNTRKKLKIPHMGWNLVNPTSYDNLFKGLEDEARFYYVHSYHAVCYNQENVLGTCEYGYEFASTVQNENIFGVQFHPEKSHKFGLTLFKNFLELL